MEMGYYIDFYSSIKEGSLLEEDSRGVVETAYRFEEKNVFGFLIFKKNKSLNKLSIKILSLQ